MTSPLPDSSSKTHFDQSSDDPKQARAQFVAMADNLNQIRLYLIGLFGADGEKDTARTSLQYGGVAASALDLDGLTIKKSAIERATAASVGSGTHTLDYNNGSWHKITATGDFELDLDNFPTAGAVVYIEAVNWGAHGITLPIGLKTPEGDALEFTEAGTDVFALYKLHDDTYVMKAVDVNIGVPV